jgi:hypothetical protein
MIGETNKNDGKGIQEKGDKDLFLFMDYLRMLSVTHTM